MVLAQTVISTLIILVTGEFLPKTIFKINPNLVLNVFAIPLIICYVILYPISKLASGLSCLFLRVFGMKINKDASDRAFGKSTWTTSCKAVLIMPRMRRNWIRK